MAKVSRAIETVVEKEIVDKIYFIRGQKVMLDRDLAEMYGVETKRLKEQVRRNIQRFPDDFMFEMTTSELANWRSQFATSNSENMGVRYLPFCFTEQGVSMLSSVLNSETAIQVNIQIIRIFTRMKQVLMDNKDLWIKVERIEQDLAKKDDEITTIFKALKQLLQPPPESPREPIGFPYPGKK
jgi:phage regulator Rha-like protein